MRVIALALVVLFSNVSFAQVEDVPTTRKFRTKVCKLLTPEIRKLDDRLKAYTSCAEGDIVVTEEYRSDESEPVSFKIRYKQNPEETSDFEQWVACELSSDGVGPKAKISMEWCSLEG